MNDIVTNPPVRARRELTRADIVPLDEYVKIRTQRRRETTELKRRRRVEVGPFATFYFENFATMWQQVQEMLYIEKGGDEQLADELEAYNPLIPQGDELVATVMFEVEDSARRAVMLARLGGIEDRAFIDVSGERIRGEPDPTRENTSPGARPRRSSSSASASRRSRSPRSSSRAGRSPSASTIRITGIWQRCPRRSAPLSPRISISSLRARLSYCGPRKRPAPPRPAAGGGN
jgi:Protein of unknown function (DUF3501)